MSVTWTDEVRVVRLGGVLALLEVQSVLLRSSVINRANQVQQGKSLARPVLILELLAHSLQPTHRTHRRMVLPAGICQKDDLYEKGPSQIFPFRIVRECWAFTQNVAHCLA
eukprot:8814530-Pyramimonas_sp.AAC.1